MSFTAASAAGPTPASAGGVEWLEAYRAQAVETWETEIRQLEARDAAEPDPADAILFVGSSSIRLWDSIATDMAPYRVIQRGVGGSTYSDIAIFAERLLLPHRYRALVVFVANDVTPEAPGRTPQEVERLVRHVLGVSRRHQPDAPVLLVEVTPSGSRFAVWPEIRAINVMLREIALTTPDTYFVATAEHYLDPEGKPRNELFVDDQLHLNGDGYALWSELIRRRLDEVLRQDAAFDAADRPRTKD
jgi:lysophospholipase L1-like esterase